VTDATGISAHTIEVLTVNSSQTGGGSSGSGGNHEPTVWANGATPIDSQHGTPHPGEIRNLATTQMRGATWWLVTDSLVEEQEHELIPDGDEVYVKRQIPRGAQ
jgi:hypothetical protein